MSTYNSQSGFSLVETLVSITILLLVIVGPMTIMSSTANSTSFASEQVVAFFLAQEGAELAQKARDDIVLNRFLDSSDGRYVANPWAVFSDDAGFYSDCFESTTFGDGCGLEISNTTDGAIETPTSCAGAGTCMLYYDASGTGRSHYTYDDGGGVNERTIYTREIIFENINAYEIRVLSRVEWFTGNSLQTQSVEVETFLVDVYGS